MPPRYLASDLDGTLIPPEIDADRRREIAEFAAAVGRAGLSLAYITGRHPAMAIEGVRTAELPWPDRLFCDVGTSLYIRARGEYRIDPTFRHAMTEALGMASIPEIERLLDGIAGLERQEEAKQAEFKLSYYLRGDHRREADAELRRRLAPLDARVTVISSEDPVTGDGLVDILPRAAGKRRALAWLCDTLSLQPEAVLYAGDSGNDRDALTSGHPAVLVGNAPDDLRLELAEAVRDAGLADRLYQARASYAAGVLEGCRHFGFL